MINNTINKVQSQTEETRKDVRQATQKALYLQLGVAGLAYDAVKNAIENSQDFFSRAIDRGEKVENNARKEFNKAYNRAEDRINTMQTRAKSMVRRAEYEVEENIEVVSEKVDAAGAAAKAVSKTRVPELKAPFANYDEMTAKEIVAKIDGMANEELRQVKLYEAANQNRVTVMREVDRQMAELPIPNYDKLTVAEIEPMLVTLSKEQLKSVRAYEVEHDNRVTLLDEIDAQLK